MAIISAVVNAEMLVKADIHQSVVTRPAVRMNDRSWVNVTAEYPLEYAIHTDKHNFCVDHALTLEQPKGNRLPVGATPTSASNTVGTEVGFIYFNRTIQGRGLLTSFSQSLTNLQLDRIYRAKRDTRHFRSYRCRQIHRKTKPQLAKFSLADSRTALAPVFSYHFRRLS